MALAAIFVLFASVLLHEWSHWWVARRFAMEPDTLVLGPLGGLSEWGTTTAARREFACLMAGPLANLLAGLVCAGTLYVGSPPDESMRLFNPLLLDWGGPTSSLAEQGLQLCLWVNWLLFLFNLLPAFPFDGGRALRAGISYVRPRWSERRVAEMVFWIAVALAGVIMATALVLWKRDYLVEFPASIAFALLLLAVVLLVSARRDVENAGDAITVTEHDTQREAPWPVAPAYDASAEAPSVPVRWMPPSAATQDEPRPEEIEAEEERQVDGILSRLHAHGIESLTPEQRHLLDRVSARYRNRLGRHT